VPDEQEPETAEEKRQRVMRRLAEILHQPPPSTGPPRGPVTAGSLEEAIGALGLGLSEENTGQVADALREGPAPEEAAALLHHLLESFEAWRRPAPDPGSSPDPGTGPTRE
jgi:DNA-binding transcriptional ArsR family regulator